MPLGARIVQVTISITIPMMNRQQRSGVRKLDLLHLCFSLNFYFLMFLSQFPSMFPLLTYSQSFFHLSADYLRHSREGEARFNSTNSQTDQWIHW